MKTINLRYTHMDTSEGYTMGKDCPIKRPLLYWVEQVLGKDLHMNKLRVTRK